MAKLILKHHVLKMKTLIFFLFKVCRNMLVVLTLKIYYWTQK